MEGWKLFLSDILRRIIDLERNVSIKRITIPTDGYFIVKKVTSDPVSPIEGEVWENTTSHELKMYLDGTVRVFTFV
jgi:hypothetical protein